MTPIATIDELEATYDGPPQKAALTKVQSRLTPLHRQWIMASRFCILSTVGPEGTDASPRGDDGPVVEELDEKTLALPDWRGNNRLDSLRNIVRDGRVSLMFMVPGSNSVVRVNGTAILTADAELCGRFERKGMWPRSVIVVTIAELYVQCAKALMRSRLWSSEAPADLPKAGDLIQEADDSFDGAAYDARYRKPAELKMW
jgi:PPOX class probable FMN-dependent enzyme